MKVLAVLHYSVFGGPSNLLMAIAGPLRERGIELSVAMPSGPGDAALRLRDAGIRVLEMRLGRLRDTYNPVVQSRVVCGFPGDVRRLRGAMRIVRPDAVLLTGLLNPHAAIAARLEHTPVVWQVVDTGVPEFARRPLMYVLEHLGDVAMFWGEGVMRAHTNGLPPPMPVFFFGPPVTDHLGPSANYRRAVREELRIPAEAALVGMVGNFNPQKGIEYFIRAAGRIHRVREDAWFVIVGPRLDSRPDYAERLEEEIARSGIPRDRLLLPGARNDVYRFYPSLDVLVVSSVPRSEGIATVAVEASYCEVPVVTTDVGAMSEAVVDGATGFVVPPLDDQAIADAVQRLLADPALRSRLGSNGRAHVQERYSLQSCADIHTAALKAAVARGRPDA